MDCLDLALLEALLELTLKPSPSTKEVVLADSVETLPMLELMPKLSPLTKVLVADSGQTLPMLEPTLELSAT